MKHAILMSGIFLLSLPLFAQHKTNSVATTTRTVEPARTVLVANLQAADADVPQEGQVDELPKPLKRVDPSYPELARKAGIEGKVYVEISIDTAGRVTAAKVLKTDHETLNESALQAARQWTFTPAMKDKKKVPLVVTVPFAFKLADKTESKTAKEKEAYALPQSVRALLAGSDTANLRKDILPGAYLIDGNVQVNLLEALSGGAKTRVFSTERSRAIGTIRMNMNDEGTAAFVVAMTEGENRSAPRWHTVIWGKTKEGNWKIQHWHTSR